MSLEEILTRAKWKWEEEWNISFLKHSTTYIIILEFWSHMKLEDELEVLPMLILEIFLDQFVFIWGCEQCSNTSSEISPKSHYYLKDLK
jgi:hypothetical protein